MKLLLDADGTIKLHRAGVLEQAANVFQCVMPEEVYHEVVVQGREGLHLDAEAIAEIVERAISVRPTPTLEISDPGFGVGEKAVLALFHQGIGEVVISDDRRFLNLLTREQIPFLVPTDLIVGMTVQGVLSANDATTALEHLRPFVSDEHYRLAVQDLGERRIEVR